VKLVGLPCQTVRYCNASMRSIPVCVALQLANDCSMHAPTTHYLSAYLHPNERFVLTAYPTVTSCSNCGHLGNPKSRLAHDVTSIMPKLHDLQAPLLKNAFEESEGRHSSDITSVDDADGVRSYAPGYEFRTHTLVQRIQYTLHKKADECFFAQVLDTKCTL
jgi:hypothetical protein